MGVCGTCGSPWVRTTSDFWGCSRFRYGGPCTNNRLINNKGYQERVLTELKNGMLAPEVVSAYVREYHRDFARASADLGRSEEHTSELQSLLRTSYAVFCLKKKNN